MKPDILAEKEGFSEFKTELIQHKARIFIILDSVENKIRSFDTIQINRDEYNDLVSQCFATAESIRIFMSDHPHSIISTLTRISDAFNQLIRTLDLHDNQIYLKIASKSTLVTGTGSQFHTDLLKNQPLPPGFQWVEISQILPRDLTDGINQGKMNTIRNERWFEKLEMVVFPALKEDPTRGKDYFKDVDHSHGLAFPNGFQKIFEEFFCSEYIHFSTIPGSTLLRVENGIHRTLVAKQLGWTAVPAKITQVGQKS